MREAPLAFHPDIAIAMWSKLEARGIGMHLTWHRLRMLKMHMGRNTPVDVAWIDSTAKW